MNVQGLINSRPLGKGEVGLHLGNKGRVVALTVGTYYLSLPSGVVLESNNCYYVPVMSRNIIFISCLDMIGFSFIIKDNTCSIYHGDIFYGDAHLSNGLYILNHDNPNAKAIYIINIKRFKSNDLNTAYFCHYRLGHINEKRISKLHLDGLLHSFDFESYEVYKSCLLGKITKAPFTGYSERANNLLGLIHSAVCGPISSIARGGFNTSLPLLMIIVDMVISIRRNIRMRLLKCSKHSRIRYKSNLIKVLKHFEHIKVVNT